MSLPTSVSKQASGCVVLRVKRKREEDPAEALGVFILIMDGLCSTFLNASSQL